MRLFLLLMIKNILSNRSQPNYKLTFQRVIIFQLFCIIAIVFHFVLIIPYIVDLLLDYKDII